MNEWISVEDELPSSHSGSVLMATKHGVAEGHFLENKWCQYRWSCSLGKEEVTHWMPLPEPPNTK